MGNDSDSNVAYLPIRRLRGVANNNGSPLESHLRYADGDPVLLLFWKELEIQHFASSLMPHSDKECRKEWITPYTAIRIEDPTDTRSVLAAYASLGWDDAIRYFNGTSGHPIAVPWTARDPRLALKSLINAIRTKNEDRRYLLHNTEYLFEPDPCTRFRKTIWEPQVRRLALARQTRNRLLQMRLQSAYTPAANAND